MNNIEFSSTTFNVSTCIGLVLGIAASIFWMVVGWRAMRAGERIADSLRSLADRLERRDQE